MFGAGEEAVVHSPGETEDKEAAAAGFSEGDLGRIEQAGTPEGVVRLGGEDGGGHRAEEFFVEAARRGIGREVFEHEREAAVAPAVAAAPKGLFAGRRFFVEERGVAEKLFLGRIVKVDLSGGAQEPVVRRRDHPEAGIPAARVGEAPVGGTWEHAGDGRGGGLGGGGAGGRRECGDADKGRELGAHGGPETSKAEAESRRSGPGPRRRPRV